MERHGAKYYSIIFHFHSTDDLLHDQITQYLRESPHPPVLERLDRTLEQVPFVPARRAQAVERIESPPPQLLFSLDDGRPGERRVLPVRHETPMRPGEGTAGEEEIEERREHRTG